MAKYGLTNNLRLQTTWFIRGHEERLAEYRSLAWQSVEQDGQPKSTAPSDPTGIKAIRAARLSDDIHAVELALEQLPDFYREPVYANVVHRRPWPIGADRATFYRYRRVFIHHVAKLKGWL